MESVCVFQRYASQRLEVVNTVEAFLFCSDDLGFLGSDSVARMLRDFATKNECAALTKALSVNGGLVVMRTTNGYKLEIHRVSDLSNPKRTSESMGAGTEWVSSLVEWILRFCEFCITKNTYPRINFRSAAFIVDGGRYFTYDIKHQK